MSRTGEYSYYTAPSAAFKNNKQALKSCNSLTACNFSNFWFCNPMLALILMWVYYTQVKKQKQNKMGLKRIQHQKHFSFQQRVTFCLKLGAPLQKLLVHKIHYQVGRVGLVGIAGRNKRMKN